MLQSRGVCDPINSTVILTEFCSFLASTKITTPGCPVAQLACSARHAGRRVSASTAARSGCNFGNRRDPGCLLKRVTRRHYAMARAPSNLRLSFHSPLGLSSPHISVIRGDLSVVLSHVGLAVRSLGSSRGLCIRPTASIARLGIP